MDKYKNFRNILIHTGQHHDITMSDIFFSELKIKKPDIHLGVGSNSHAVQTAMIMTRLEDVLLKLRPNLVIVVGDVNSTLAAALVCSKLHIPLAHVEAGLRSEDLTMPEEINRIITDRLSDFLFTTSEDANKNLLKEGIEERKIYFTGNVMIDTLKSLKEAALKSDNTRKKFGLLRKGYCLITLHRPSNVDNKMKLKKIIIQLKSISKKIPVFFPAHPRTIKNINLFELNKYFGDNLILTEPVSYLENLNLMMNSVFVITDSGGIQEETTILKKPCLTLRENTERPITVNSGTNTIIGSDWEKLQKEVNLILNGKYKHGKTPKYWDGKASVRIAKIIAVKYAIS